MIISAAGRLGHVQMMGHAPGRAAANETHSYGPGAFLLAAEQMAKL
jgi:hypothetical protein